MASALKLDTIKSLSGNEAMTIHESGVPLLKVPTFEVFATTSQSVTNGVFTKVTFNTVTFDTHGWWSTVDNRYTPQIEGYYFFGALSYHGGTTLNLLQANLYKNGSGFRIIYEDRDDAADPVSTSQGGHGSAIVYMNGTTDYVEMWARTYATTPTFLAGRFFSGYLVSGV